MLDHGFLKSEWLKLSPDRYKTLVAHKVLVYQVKKKTPTIDQYASSEK